MTYNHPLTTCLVFAMLGCSSGDGTHQTPSSTPFEAIKVGMTYDEVEKQLGKPTQITRGVNSLEGPSDLEFRQSLQGLSSGELEIVGDELAFTKRVLDTTTSTHVWALPKKLSTTGQLIYVTWVYDKIALDTFIVYQPIFTPTVVEIPNGPPKYVVNDCQVTRSEYELVSDTVYRTDRYPSGWITTKSDWLDRKTSQPWVKLPKPEKATKRMVQPTVCVSKKLISGATRHLHQAKYFACVTFDASSGRVVTSSFNPFFVSEIATPVM